MPPIAADLLLGELADRTGRHVETLRRLARRGRLPGSYRLGGRWLFRREALESLRRNSGKAKGSRPNSCLEE